MNGDPVLVPHLVKLVNADDSTVGEDHRAAFEVKLPRLRIPLHRRRQTCRRGPLARSVDRDRRDFLDEFQQLRFGGTGVTEHEDVDVATEAHAVGQDLL